MNGKYASEISKELYSKLVGNLSDFPFKMNYGGNVYHGFPEPDFWVTDKDNKVSDNKISDIITLAGPQNLTVILKAGYWIDYGVLEWTVEFENRGNENTAWLSDVYCCEMDFKGDNPVLRGILGDHDGLYEPYEVELEEYPAYFESLTGRPTHADFPYFNLEYGSGGVMLAIGWAGSWGAKFETKNGKTYFSGHSTVRMSLNLKPGEKVRTALMIVAPYYVRNEEYATNFWRSWFINCNMPKADAEGNPIKPFSTCCLAFDTGKPNSDGSISECHTTWKPSMEKMLEENIRVDFRWFDAGWYSDPEGNTVESDWRGTIGSWELDSVKWPGDSFLESTGFARKNGMKTLVWFRPEWVTNPEALERNYGYNHDWTVRFPGRRIFINNLGDPDCLNWTTGRICKMLKHNRVDMYREDNNNSSQKEWDCLDETDGRYGISEIKMVMAHYKMWDDIIEATKSNGGCAFCDSCAAGGGRNDIESLRRGIPLSRSDADRTSTALRLSMTTSFNKWIPFNGANSREKTNELSPKGSCDKYIWRASYLPVLNVDAQFVQDPDQDFDILRFGLDEWKKVNQYLLADFYVLTPWHESGKKDAFTAFSYYDDDMSEGVLFVFRMEKCEDDTFCLNLPYAVDGKYILIDADDEKQLSYYAGIPITMKEKRTAKLYFVKKMGLSR